MGPWYAIPETGCSTTGDGVENRDRDLPAEAPADAELHRSPRSEDGILVGGAEIASIEEITADNAEFQGA